MGVLDHAARERQTDAPPATLRGDSGLEQSAADLLGNARPVIDHPHFRRSLLRADPQDNRSAASLQRVDGVLDQRFQRPLEQHRIALDHGTHAGRLEPQLDRVGPAREAGTVVAGHPVRQRTETDRLPPRGIADPLESPGHALEPLRVGREVIGQVRWRCRPGADPLDPALEAGERRAHLMRRLARHGNP